MSDEGGAVTSVEHQGFSIQTNTGSKKEVMESLGVEEKSKPKSATPPAKEPKSDEEKRSEAASELGKAGGKASAEKRKIKPIPPKQEATDAGNETDAKAAGKDDSQTDAGAEDRASKADAGVDGDAEETPEQKAYREEGERRKRDAKARVEEATRTAAQAKRERDEALAALREVNERLSRLETGGAKPDSGASRELPKGKGEPNLDEYDDLAAYVRDMQKYAIEQTVTELQQKAQAEQAEQARYSKIMEAREKFSERVKSFWAENEIDPSSWAPLAEQLVTTFQLPPGQPIQAINVIADEIFGSEQAPVLMSHLLEHPDELQRIAALPTAHAVSRAMAKLETRLEVASAGSESDDSHDTKREKSKAPPPVTPVPGSPYVADGDGAPKPGESFDSWFKRSGRKGLNLPTR